MEWIWDFLSIIWAVRFIFVTFYPFSVYTYSQHSTQNLCHFVVELPKLELVYASYFALEVPAR
uniref:Uncharacterized protein n=1 Tax=Arundo donax TaxID=35708 RepID=A0A0A9GWP2_ARUDO